MMEDFPDPEGPTRATVVPGLFLRNFPEIYLTEKLTWSKTVVSGLQFSEKSEKNQRNFREILPGGIFEFDFGKFNFSLYIG
jgi:hypothetical protein